MSPPCFRCCPCKWGMFRHSKKTTDQDDTKAKGSRWQTLRQWLSRCPFPSCVAFFMCTGASVVFGVCLYEAIEYLVLLLELNIVKIAIWAVVGVHILVATYFLVVATLSTGRTREEVTAISKGFNFIGRCAHAGCIATAYVFHLIWLILPAVLLLPLAILIGLCVTCRVVPDCVTLSDYGISPEVVDKYGPETIANTIRNFNESIILDYADKAESFLLSSIDKVEDSPMLEQLISQIEAHIPDPEEADRFISTLLEKVNLEQLTGLLEQAEGGLGYFDKLVEMLEGLPNMGDMVGKLIDMRPDFGDSLEGPIAEIGEHVDKGLDAAESWIDKADNMTQQGIDSAVDAANNLLNETKGHLDDLDPNYDRNITESAAKVGSEYLNKTAELSANIDTMTQNLSLPSSLPDEMSGDFSNLLPNSTDGEQYLNASSLDYDDILSSGEEERIAELDGVVPSPSEDGDVVSQLEGSGIPKFPDMSEEQASGEEAVEDLIEEQVQQVQNAAEDVAQHINEHADKAQYLAEDLAGDVSQHVEQVRELTDDISKHVGNVGEMVEGLSEEVEETARQLIHEARSIAEQAQKMAQEAAEEAEIAVRRAEQLAREAALEVDLKAREFALDAAEKAKEAARAAKDAAADAIERAQVALLEADDVIRAASRGAITWAREAMSKVRYYAKKAFGWARHAVKEARRGADIAVKYIGIAKREFLKTYEIAKEYYHKLEIRRIGKDTFCSDVKVMVCDELQKSAICFILVFLSSIIINLSMVHFLMAMTANYVHLKEEVVKQKLKRQLMASTAAPGEGSSLLFSTMDSGSLVLDVSSTSI